MGAEIVQQGTIIGERGPDLTAELDNVNPAARAAMAESPLRVSLEIDGASYAFETAASAVPAGAEPGMIHLRKPATITLVDRRRSPRRRLHEPAEILLRVPDINETWQCKAAMLNLSLDGVACRIPKTNAGSLDTGHIVRISLRLDASSDAFELDGQIINITQGGTPDHLVVGLKFVADEKLEASRAEIRDALETATRGSGAR